MRRVLLLIAVALLAVPAAAFASHAGSASTTQIAAKQKPKPGKKSKKHQKTKQAQTSSASQSGVLPGSDEREAKGAIVALAPLTVGTLACEVPPTVSTAGFAVGDIVEIKCDLLNGVWTLRKLKREDDIAAGTGKPGHEVEVKGTIVSLSPLQVGTTTCAVPDGMSLAGFEVGQTVELECKLDGGILTVMKLKHEDDGDDNGDANSGSNSGPSRDDDGGDHSGSGHGGDHSGSGGNDDSERG